MDFAFTLTQLIESLCNNWISKTSIIRTHLLNISESTALLKVLVFTLIIQQKRKNRGEYLTVTSFWLISFDTKRCGLRRKGAGSHPRLHVTLTLVRDTFKAQALSIHRPPTDILWSSGTVMTALFTVHNSLPLQFFTQFRDTIMLSHWNYLA